MNIPALSIIPQLSIVYLRVQRFRSHLSQACWVLDIDSVYDLLRIKWIWPALPLASLLSIKYRPRLHLLSSISASARISRKIPWVSNNIHVSYSLSIEWIRSELPLAKIAPASPSRSVIECGLLIASLMIPWVSDNNCASEDSLNIEWIRPALPLAS